MRDFLERHFYGFPREGGGGSNSNGGRTNFLLNNFRDRIRNPTTPTNPTTPPPTGTAINVPTAPTGTMQTKTAWRTANPKPAGMSTSQWDSYYNQYVTNWKNTNPINTVPNPANATNMPTGGTPGTPPPAQDAIPVPGNVQMNSALSQAQWQTQVPMPSGGWTLSDGKKTTDATKAYNDYKANFKPTPTNSGQMNIVDYAGQLVNDPSKGLTLDNPATPNVNESMFMSDHVQGINENAQGTNLDPNDPRFAQQQTQNQTAAQGQAAQAGQVQGQQANTYEAQQTQQNVAQNGQATAQQGQVSQEAQIDAPQLDMQGSATGTNADGSTNYTGQALQQYASQNISNIIDTSTPSGKALAEALGEGNYVDSKATLQGQLQMLQSQFVGPNGEPKIPAWAAGTARNVSKIAAFRGMTGSAATAAMSQALMEASIPIAQQDAQFFQTVTLQNLSNKQAATINRANVLAKFDLTNLDNRMAAAVENAKSFLQMDLANLDNAQQAEIINTQNRVQSILEDAKSVNAQRMFTAESQNDMDKFYANLNAAISQFNVAQQNGMTQFNTSEQNAMTKFNADMENNRQQFYKEMQYNIDIANAKWRQSVTMEESQQAFEAAATDVKNMVGISQEQLNQIWDRSDALLDYIWKSSENELDRKSAMAIAKVTGKMQNEAADAAGWGSIFGSIAGKGAEALFDWAF